MPDAFLGGGDALPLERRGLIADGETAALVARDGTIDWWCPGRFDADPALHRLLDPDGGAVRISPAGAANGPPSGDQRYEADDHVLATRFFAGEAEVEVVDLLPWRGAGHRAEGRIVRLVTARRGPVDVEIVVQPGNRWRAAREVHAWSEGIAFDGVVVRARTPFVGRRGLLRMEAGEHAVVTVDVEAADGTPLAPPVSVDAALDLVRRTRDAWQARLTTLAYDGQYRDAVRRSLLVLLGLTYSPTGALVAAPTTSLPGRAGGERNWDHRYAWLRDATLAVLVCDDVGLPEEAERFLSWVAGRCHGARFPMRPFHVVDGDAAAPSERELPLRGWRGSRPVRVGNADADHPQLDFYGDVAAVFHDGRVRDGTVAAVWPDVVRMGEWLADAWTTPDTGIWGIRAGPRHLVGSKLSCWAALDRIARLEARRDPLSLEAAALRVAARDVIAWLEAHGLAADGGLRADARPVDAVEASLLSVAWRNPWPHEPWRAERTVDRVLRRLGAGPFVHRYDSSFDDGIEPGEGAFVACSFWAVEALAALGRWDEAHERMEALCDVAAPLGLLPEQVEPTTREWLGNLPHASSHLALVRAAVALDRGPR